MAGGAKMPPLAGESQMVLMVAVPAFHPGNAVAQISAIEIPVDDLPEVVTEESIRSFKPLFVGLDEGIKILFDAAVIIVAWGYRGL
jgi:hypothetical protein